MNPLPTPFDIVEIDYFPAAPPLWIWLLLFAVGAAAYSILKLIKHKLSKPKSELKDLNLLTDRLQELSASEKGDFDRISSEASILIRGFLSYRYNVPFDSFSSSELKSYASRTTDQTLKEILSEVAELEIIRYQPSINAAKKFKEAAVSINSLLRTLDANTQEPMHA